MKPAVASQAARLLAELRGSGFLLDLAADGTLRVSPAADLDRRLRRLVGREKVALAALLAAESNAVAEVRPPPAPSAEDAAEAPRRAEEAAEVIVGYRRRRGRASEPITIPIPRGASTREAVAAMLVGRRRTTWDQALAAAAPWERD